MIDRRQMLAFSAAALAACGARAQGAPTVAEVLYDKEAPVLGNPEGSVTVVEYFDYQCGYCKQGHAPLMRVVEKDGDVRLVLKDWPIFGPVSIRAARRALAARGAGDYRKAMEALISAPGKLSDARIDEVLKDGGLDPDRLEAAYKTDAARIDALIGRNEAQADAFGFRGTPSFVIGTRLYGGALSEEELTAAIKQARKA